MGSILKIAILSIVFVGFSSCVKKSWDFSYSGEENYQSLYITDTIEIKDPVMVTLSKRGRSTSFYISEDDLDIIYDKNLEEISQSPKVFFSGSNLFEYFPLDFPIDKIYDCMGSSIKDARNGIVTSSLIKPVNKFVLALVTINYYNKNESSLEYLRLKTGWDKSTYIKVVFPLCD